MVSLRDQELVEKINFDYNDESLKENQEQEQLKYMQKKIDKDEQVKRNNGEEYGHKN